MFYPPTAWAHQIPLCLGKRISDNTKSTRRHDKREQKIGSESHLPGMIKPFQFPPPQQTTAAVDKRCWFRGQIKPWTGEIMCLWSINTDTRCNAFTLKLSGPAERGPSVPFSPAKLIICVAGVCRRTVLGVWILPGDKPQASNRLVRHVHSSTNLRGLDMKDYADLGVILYKTWGLSFKCCRVKIFKIRLSYHCVQR